MTSRLCCMVVGIVLACACSGSSSATLTLRSGETVSGRIVRSDETSVWIDRDHPWLEDDDLEEEIPRDRIADVSHPGQGGMIAGGILAGVGSLFLVGARSCKDEREHRSSADSDGGRSFRLKSCGLTFAVTGLAIGIPGVLLLAEGSAKYAGSSSRYGSSRGPRLRERAIPAPPIPAAEIAPPPFEPSSTGPRARSGWCELRGCPSEATGGANEEEEVP